MKEEKIDKQEQRKEQERKRNIIKNIEIVYTEDERVRLDKFLSFVLHEKYYIDITRNVIQEKIANGEIYIEDNEKEIETGKLNEKRNLSLIHISEPTRRPG